MTVFHDSNHWDRMAQDAVSAAVSRVPEHGPISTRIILADYRRRLPACPRSDDQILSLLLRDSRGRTRGIEFDQRAR